MESQYKEISIDRINDPEDPLRDDLNADNLSELVESIKTVGIIEPLIVRKVGDDFEVIAGHRRLVASRIAGLQFLPCIIRGEKDLDAEVLKLHENLARAEISPIQWAKRIDLLKQHYNLTNANIAQTLGMSDAWVSQHLEILNYPPEIYNAVEQNKLTFSAARELAQITDPTKRSVYVSAAIKGGVTPALAVQWRKEANRQALQQTTENQPIVYPGTEENSGLGKPTCPVCNEIIEPEEQLIITIHDRCQPPKE